MALERLLDKTTGPLRGLWVLDFDQAAVGSIAAEWLGMLGATVMKIEPPEGDFVRHATPLIDGMGTTFIGNNLTKFGVVIDLKTGMDGAAKVRWRTCPQPNWRYRQWQGKPAISEREVVHRSGTAGAQRELRRRSARRLTRPCVDRTGAGRMVLG
ncbi:MAG: CoA transferase [Candidatus Binataceae bacterium]